MLNKKVVIICNTGELLKNRILAVKEVFAGKGYDVKILTSDFLHNKMYIDEASKVEDFDYIHARKYKKNISAARLLSYINWSKKSFKIINEEKPDIIYINIPINYLLKLAAKFKKKNPNVEIIADIIDLWPESLPVKSGLKKLLSPMLNVWRNYRNKNLKYCDLVFTECEYYKQVLSKEKINTESFVTLYLFNEQTDNPIEYIPSETLRFLYLGSINNIIDIEKTICFLAEIKKHKEVLLNIIGDGEQRDKLISLAKENGIETVYLGKVYDDAIKQNVMNNCDFGLNIYKESVEVGLTIKSIDYMRGGLPIINTIKGDTKDLIEKENIGFNLSDSTVYQITELTFEGLTDLRTNTLNVYNKTFTKEKFIEKLNSSLPIFGDF